MWINGDFIDDINEYLESIIDGNFVLNNKKFEKYDSSKYNKTISLLTKLNSRLSTMVEDSDMMNSAARSGQLDVRIDTSKYRGDFAKITNGINDTIGATVDALRDVGDNLDRLSAGDFSAKIEKEYDGDYAVLKRATNNLGEYLNNLIVDSNMMNSSARSGLLDMRIDTSKYRGDFAKITNGINDTIGATVDALRDVGENLDRLSAGDFSTKIEKEYDGDYAVLKSATNNLGEYLNNLISDSNMMNIAVKDGILSTRIDTSKYRGDFAKITNGINDTMDSSENIAWIKDGVNRVSKELNGNLSLNDICIKSIETIATYLNAGVGALYLYDKDKELLELHGTYAYIERNSLGSSFGLGEGTVGQVARQRSPILLKNIKRDQMLISTGTTEEPPINIYTYPLIYQDALYGVIEIGVSEELNRRSLEFFDEVNDLVATSIYAGHQSQIVSDLLEETNKANQQLQLQSEKLQTQSEELQQSNAELEEQQQRLEEANAQMEEQQQMLESSKIELEKKNIYLESSTKELIDKTKELELSSKYKSEFLANMSHELRTPLNSIILLSSLLAKNSAGRLSQEDMKKADTIYQSGNELLKLIGDILDLAKVESGKVEVSVERFDTEKFASELKDMFEHIAKSKKLEFGVVDNAECSINSDRSKLTQIVRNLLSNAFKFTKEGSIDFVIDKYDKGVVISIKDTGIGIPEDKQSKIFEAFAQVDGSTSREYGGTGLGLSISREFAKLIGANIELRSEVSKGSEFRVYIPTLDMQEYVQSSKKVEFDDRSTLGLRENTFLVVESDMEFASRIRENINQLQHKAIIVKNAKDAKEILKEYNVSGIFLDLELENMSGMEFLRELKSDSIYRKIPIFIISSSDTNTKFLQMGAIGHLQKPVDEMTLLTTIKDVIKFQEKKVKNLLIVENDISTRESIIELIGNGTIKSQGVSTKDEAIEEIEKGIYDLVIVDLHLDNNKDGFEMCEYIKKSNHKLPIIIYTAQELSVEEDNILQKYTDSIIIKKAHSDERLLSEVDLFLHRAKINSDKISQTISSISLENTKVLIVDDDIKNIYVLESVLQEYNATTYHAKNGKEAIEFLTKNSVDIVLMDIMMPVMNGYEAMQNIRADESLKDTPIIALTAKAMKDDRQKCIDAGANDYISKPINSDKLIGMIKIWLNK
jgi:signal transduction histidine kinase/CheY-like chemotaxis protein/methyl-accepting chemotaxis protein